MAEKLLTALELKVMNLLWDKEKAFVKELIDAWDEEPKPAYNTLSTVVRILEEKGFAAHEAYGRTHRYFPAVTRAEYQRRALGSVIRNVFSGSVTDLISTISQEESLSPEEVDELKKLIEKYE
jgi:predicted transcriptional regulator